MGRVDEALQRANSGRAPSPADEDAPPESAAPWSFTESEVARDIAPPSPAREPRDPAPSGPLLGHENRMALFSGVEAASAPKLVGAASGSTVMTEEFRRLAATLHHAQVAQHLKTVMVASATPGDGKSLTAVNLALTLSQSYRRRVLLIDADLRRPSLHRIFQVPNVMGLNEGLNARSDTKLALLEVTPTLTLLPAGTPQQDPMGGLSSARMKRIVAEAVERFDWVIVDTPPVGLLADAKIVAHMVDTTLLVVRAGVTRFEDVRNAVAAVGRERIIGVVLNAVAQPANRPEYYRHEGDATESTGLTAR